MLNNKNYRIALLGILTALSIVLGYVEFLIMPDILIPGVKIGLSNLAVLVALYICDNKSALFLGVIKVTLSSVLFSGITALIYSLTGMIFSLIAMIVLKKLKHFSIYGISIAGAVMHNTGQLIAAMLISGTLGLINYLPVLLIAGMVCGLIISVPADIIIKILKKI